MVWHISQQCAEDENWGLAERVLLHFLTVDHHDPGARRELAKVYRKQGKESLAQELEARIEGSDTKKL